MLSFTYAELQKKFCEGFSFFPFQSLEQHGTLIFKCYQAQEDMQKVLEWSSREHDCSHYKVKIAKKLRYTDIPAAGQLLKALEATKFSPASQHPAGIKLAEEMEKYLRLLPNYRRNVLQHLSIKLAEEHYSMSIEGIRLTENLVRRFQVRTDVLNSLLKDYTGKRRSFAPRIQTQEERERFEALAAALDEFRPLQERNLNLLDAWKTQLALHDSKRAMN